jgi:hypothetical protein
MKPQTRNTVSLSDSVHQQLNAYALAASAAGVSLLALTPTICGKDRLYTHTPGHRNEP